MAKGEVDAQQELEDAFEAKDLDGFKRAITRGAQPNLSSKRDEDNQLSIFEKALSTRDCAKFIETCLDAGCDPNYVNSELNKAVIHYAIDSGIGSAGEFDDCNLFVLVYRPNSKVDLDHMYERETALSRLIKSLEVENPPDCYHAIRLLLNKGASPNIADSNGKTLMQQVLLNEKISQGLQTLLISVFVKAPKLSPRPLLSQHVLLIPDTLAQYQKTIVNWDNKKMLRHLLMEHITFHTENALEAVLATLEKNSPQENEYLVELAVKVNNWSTVLQLLKSEYLNLMPKGTLLKTMIMQVKLKLLINDLRRNEYQKCLQQLFKVQLQHINDFDDQHKTLLHYAVLCRNEIAIRVLLREGARLGVRNDKNRLLIEDIDAKLLEEHFDYCIFGRGEKTSHEDYEIIMNYLNMTNKYNELDIAPIACMARSKELCPLLEHPLITCFLKLKWSRLTTIFFTHFIINIILCLILGIHIWLRFPKRNNNELYIWIVKSLFQVLIGYLLIVEVISLVIIKHWSRSIIDFILIFMLILTNIECGDDIQRIITVFAIMLMSTKLIDLCLSYRPTCACCASFSLCFYVLFSKPSSTNSPNSSDLANSTNSANSTDLANSTNSANLTGSANSTDNDFRLSYADLKLSFIKTLVMFNSQYDNIDANGYFCIFVMIIFMFMVMVLTNLLGGLAVGDTQEGRNNANIIDDIAMSICHSVYPNT
ncbi:transient receptor potential cation channel protein painless-like [Drosophila albomicans]|uniref:Transient receptor potential cation channel protein painless-like n=1 Tax=Drosophila albomicans TaxID=7291 RepID=A0A6P8WJQ1_DROAB|nr:transient receptor potential cation channel protein painless-like [Drosophila albomicans]